MRDLHDLLPRDLTAALKRHGLQAKGKRLHKILLLSQKLGIDGSLDNFQEVVSLFRNEKDGWIKDLRGTPVVGLSNVLEYLVKSHETVVCNDNLDIEVFTKESIKRYKTLRSYDLYASGHVHSMSFMPATSTSEYCAVRGMCNPSWDTSGTIYQGVIIFDIYTGSPLGSGCTCTAGLGEACTHVAAILFAMEDYTSRGMHELPADLTCTEVPCAWSGVRDPHVKAEPLANLEVRAAGPSGDGGRKLRAIHQHNPVPKGKRHVDFAKYQELVHGLNLLNLGLPFCRSADDNRFNPEPVKYLGEVVTTLPDVLDMDDPRLTPSLFVSVHTESSRPETIMEQAEVFMIDRCSSSVDPASAVDDFISTLSFTQKERRDIEKLTIGQCNNTAWKMYKKGMLTSTRLHPVYTRINSFNRNENTKLTRLVNLCLGQQEFTGSAATEYGKKNEDCAALKYLNLKKVTHKNARIAERGLLISAQCPFIGTSVDRIFSCDCHPPRPVEIKCPASLEKSPKGSFGSLPYIFLNQGKLALRRREYFTQVQTHMAVTNSKFCDFVLWTPSDLQVIEVAFDVAFWTKVFANAKQFFKSFLAPAILESFYQGELPGSVEKDDFVESTGILSTEDQIVDGDQ